MKVNQAINTLPLFLLLFPHWLFGADLSTYRGFQLGMSVAAAVKHSGMNESEVTIIHERPARIEELSWRPSRFLLGDTDPVKQVLFTFYKGQLSRMVVDYDDRKTEGMSVQDIIDGVSTRYGTATRPVLDIVFPSDSFSGGVTVVARWEDRDYSLSLVQSPYGSNFGLIALSKRLDGLAQASIATGIQMEQQESPQRKKSDEHNAQLQLDKARLLNRPSFRP